MSNGRLTEQDLAPHLTQKINNTAAQAQDLETRSEDLATQLTYKAKQHYVDVTEFGAKSDGAFNSTTSIKNAIAKAEEIKATGQKPILYFPVGSGFLTTESIVVGADIDVIMESPIIYNGSLNEAILTVGEIVKNSFRQNHKLSVKRKNQSDWTSEDNIAIKIINLVSSNVEIVEASNATIGVQLLGDNRAFAYNNFNLLYIANNKVGLDLKPRNTGGYVNENIFNGGRFACASGVSVGLSRYGVRFSSENSYYNNNNVFLKPCFELSQSVAGAGKEALPVLVEYGSNNEFKNIRSEGNSSEFLARHLNNSLGNTYPDVLCMGGSSSKIESNNPFNFSTAKENNVLSYLKPLMMLIKGFSSIHKKANGTTDISVQDLFFIRNNSTGTLSNTAPSTDVIINPNYLEVIGTHSIGTYLSTKKCKKFVITSDLDDGYTGRMVIIAFDVNGNRLSNAGVVKDYSSDYTYFSSSHGGAYREGNDRVGARVFSVKDEVDHVIVGFGGGSNPLRIRGFSISTLDNNYTSTWALS